MLQKVERRTYALAGVGKLRFEKFWGDDAVAETDASTWSLERRGLLNPRAIAIDVPTGSVAAVVRLGHLSEGGTLEFDGIEIDWRGSDALTGGWCLARGSSELVRFHGSGWGPQPIRIAVADSGQSFPPVALLLGCWLARRVARNSTAPP